MNTIEATTQFSNRTPEEMEKARAIVSAFTVRKTSEFFRELWKTVGKLHSDPSLLQDSAPPSNTHQTNNAGEQGDKNPDKLQ